MVEARDDDLIAWLQLAADRPADGKGQRGHVGAEDNLFRLAGEKIRHGETSAGKHGIGTLAGGKEAVRVGVAGAQIVRDCVDDFLRDLGSTGAVKIDHGVAMNGLRQRRKLRADPADVEGIGILVLGREGELFGGAHGFPYGKSTGGPRGHEPAMP